MVDDQQTTAHRGILAKFSAVTQLVTGHSAQERPGTFIVKSLQPQVPVEGTVLEQGWKGVMIDK